MNALSDCGLRDLGYQGDVFTWCNRRPESERIFERLDRYAGNEEFHCLFPHFQVSNLDWACFDHRPIDLSLELVSRVLRQARKGHGFKFNV